MVLAGLSEGLTLHDPISLEGCRVIPGNNECNPSETSHILQHATLISHTLLSLGGHASDSDDITADGQDGISFVNPIGEIFLHPLAGTTWFLFSFLFFLLFPPSSLFFFPPPSSPVSVFYSFR